MYNDNISTHPLNTQCTTIAENHSEEEDQKGNNSSEVTTDFTLYLRSLEFNGEKEDEDPPREFGQDQIQAQLARLPKRVKGKHPKFGGVKIERNVLVELNWTKRSFYELEYWSFITLKHNLDVMHIEKNVLQSILNTLLLNDKSKDTAKARQDLKRLGIQKAISDGPIFSQWMYPFERLKLKNYVRYKAKQKGSIAEGYITKEALTFSSHYFWDVTTKFSRPDRNVDCPNLTCQFQVFKSLCKSISLRSVIRIDHRELKKVIWYVLHNSLEIDTYWAKLKSGFPNKDMKEEFPGWFGKQMESSTTREYPSLIHTFLLTHTVGGVFLNPEDNAIYATGLGSDTPSGVPYTNDEIMVIVRGGKQRGHILDVGMVLSGQGTVIPPPPPCTHSSDATKLKKSEKLLTKQVNMFMKLFRSDDKFSQMLTQLESQPEYGGGSGSGWCGDDEPGDDEDGGEDEDDIKDNLRNAYEKCTDISQESHALIDTFLKEGSDKDYKLNVSMYRKAAKLEKQMDAKLAWLLEKYYYRSETHIGGSSSQTHEIGDVYLTAKELHQLHIDEKVLRETLEEQTIDEKAREEKIMKNKLKLMNSFWNLRW
nr:hypothetical protein [Tanacetum cinerariifolium]